MFVIEVFIPLTETDGQPFHAALFQAERTGLTETFGGVSTYTRTSTSDLWERRQDAIHDDLIVFEVIADVFDHEWWVRHRTQLECTFRQDRIVIRAFEAQFLSDR